MLDAVEIGETVLYQQVRDEIVLLDMQKQRCYGLDPVGADMWHALMQHGRVELALD